MGDIYLGALKNLNKTWIFFQNFKQEHWSEWICFSLNFIHTGVGIRLILHNKWNTVDAYDSKAMLQNNSFHSFMLFTSFWLLDTINV